jgi:cytochrome c peroxidase
MDADLEPVEDPLFGFEPQVTRRMAQTVIMAAYSQNAQFWDGRRAGTFVNPQTGAATIPNGGALENQALEPILSDVEMGHRGRTWNDVVAKLEAARPLALASNLPPDIAGAVANATYPQLFENAFGTPEISAQRIAFAIATYERTLVPNQTPFDRFNAGDPTALTPAQRAGLDTFTAAGSRCVLCHGGNLFTDNTFHNLGLRPPAEDPGRFEVTGAPADRGRFKTPTLRNVGLKNRFMHNGRLTSLEQVVDFYRQVNGQVAFPDNRDPAVNGINIPPQQVPNLVEFLRNGLTDPRVASEQFPFDRPRLRSELLDGDLNCDGFVTVGDIRPFVLVLSNPEAYAVEYPNCNASAADLNLDGQVTVGDIGAFVELLTAG